MQQRIRNTTQEQSYASHVAACPVRLQNSGLIGIMFIDETPPTAAPWLQRLADSSRFIIRGSIVPCLIEQEVGVA